MNQHTIVELLGDGISPELSESVHIEDSIEPTYRRHCPAQFPETEFDSAFQGYQTLLWFFVEHLGALPFWFSSASEVLWAFAPQPLTCEV